MTLEQEVIMKTYRISIITVVCAFAFITFGCSSGGGDESTTEPTVITWDKLIWDDGSNDPNTHWED